MPEIVAAMTVPSAAAAGRRPVEAPFDGAVLAEVETVDEQGVDAALETAFRLSRKHRHGLPVPRRIEILERFGQQLQEDFEALALVAAREGGKPLQDSRVEVARTIDSIRICAECLRSGQGEMIPMGINAASEGKRAFTTAEPIGVVVAVSAFNHPLNLIAHQVGPAVAAGCPVIVKPADDTPLSCFRFVAMLREAGLPEAWCQALLPRDLDVAERLVTDPRVAFFSFVGSATVGWRLRSRLAPGTRCALEHGGAAPVIVAADADLDQVVPKLLKGGFYHAGQVCVSVQRVFVHEAIMDELAARLADGARRLCVGDPTRSETEVGPLIRPAEVERVQAWVDAAVAGGGQVLAGGEAIDSRRYACTVIAEPRADARVSREEVFGPVICLYGFATVSDAVERANDLPWAFQAAVFTRDMETAMQASHALDASAVMVNEHTAFRVDWMPFAGLRQSGLGVGGIPYTWRDMQVQKMIVLPDGVGDMDQPRAR